MIAFVFMMLLTTADVIGAKVFLSPIPGALDLMMLAQLVALSFALGASYLVQSACGSGIFYALAAQIASTTCGRDH